MIIFLSATTSICALLLMQLLNAPVINATIILNNLTSSNNMHEIVRHTATSSFNQDRPQLSSQFSKLVKLDPNSSNVRSLSQQHLIASLNPSRFHNQTISDLSSINAATKSSGDNQTDQTKRGPYEKNCMGTTNRLSRPHGKNENYQKFVERYSNCTHVMGNLELTWLEESPEERLDLSFLESIREISGHLLVAFMNVEKISLPNLQIIRGRELYQFKSDSDELAILLLDNSIKSLELPNLREILAGSVKSIDNKNLCHLRTINWEEILNAPYKATFTYESFGQPECPPCDNSCMGNCWAEGSDMCQKFSKTACAPQCNQGRCFGSEPRQCCHLFCAGGCTGPKQTDCIACKNFSDDGECVQECPPMQKYNPTKFSWEPNPRGKYAYGPKCVKECPDHLLRDNGACVLTCPPNKRSLNGECVSCSGPCPKECQGDIVHSGNIDRFVNCTIIEGSITILETSFKGYTDYKQSSPGPDYGEMHPSKLMALKNVREITGYLNIQASHPDFTNLSFLRKLEIIGGRQTYDMVYALSIFKTSLRSLNLRSLKRVKSGKVTIHENLDLCFEDTDKWLQANITKFDDLIIRNNGDNGRCRASGYQCHQQCGPGGCWGPGADECLTCNNYRFEDSCVVDCASTTKLLNQSSFDTGNRTCKRCHSECLSGCNGTESSDCFQCKNVKDGPYCVSECPSHKFNNKRTCEECDKGCVGGCTGPSNILGPGGCNSCGKVVLRASNSFNASYCLKYDESCPEGYYTDGVFTDSHLKALAGKPVCRKCHHRCKSCTGMGTHRSVCECAKFIAGEQCEDTCPRDSYADARSGHCIRCAQECNGCYGPTEMDCLACRVYRVYQDDDNLDVSSTPIRGKHIMGAPRQQHKFNCTAHCPPDKPHRIISDGNLSDPYCSDRPGSDMIVMTSLLSTGPFIFFMIIASILILVCGLIYKCKIEKDKTVKLTMRLSGFDDVEPLNQSNVKPNLSAMIIIKETELRRGKELGSGYGGTVYQGIMCPEGQDSKRPVAIKVLRDNGQANMNKEFLDEAYNMASVNHPNLVSLLAVCETPTQLMLVTPLIPLGCLLDYVRNNKNNIGSKNLLEWSKQIARGMAYLEEKHMVHRDLALRNILLQTPGKALISDFGLAKFLEVDQSEYHSGGGRLPIKWLAPECISKRLFTHKSDVWAFGVTVWELLSFGKTPYEGYEAKDVPPEIEKGLRCPQPEGVTVEVYKELLACWFYIPDRRPSFKYLVDRFVNFARDPERYLNCNNNKGIDIDQELGRSSDNDENICDQYRFYDEGTPFHSILPDLTTASSTHNGRNEMIGFELRHHSESEGINGQNHVSTPTSRKLQSHVHQSIDEDVFSSATNSIFSKPQSASFKDLNNNNNAHGSNNNFSIVSKYAELPTDNDDYLLPSPCSNEEKFSKFLETHGHCTSKLSPTSPSSRDPPHSAGLIGVSNAEYFISRSNYVSSNGAPTNASSGHIPHSLV